MLGRFVRIGFVAALIAGAAFGGHVALKEPRTDRLWQLNFEKMAQFEPLRDGRFRLTNARAFEFGLEGPLREEWETIDLDTEDLTEVWFFVEPFAATDLFAHTFLSFVLEPADGERQVVSVSVEARREEGETYSGVRGFFREYELSYVWSSEKDVTTRIAVDLEHRLYAYKLNAPVDQAKAVFTHFIKRTNDLIERPRFYNTLLSNCTNELYKSVNDAFPGALPENATWALTGRSADWLYDHGFLAEKDRPFEDLRARADISGFVKTNAALPAAAFAEAWRAAYAKALNGDAMAESEGS